ncbi:hypothetical protein [Streptomyces sp. NPDC058280]|uniref:hypothetical protein n=1 Tax=Streptomyces sp. NPDC058280 TaxID=3346419 RepID=UPI0036EF9092
MSTSLSPAQRAAIAAQLGDAKAATDGLLVSFGKAIVDRREHEHPKWEDLFCLNLSSYMGERAAPVLRRLLDAEAARDELRARVADAVASVARLEQKRVELERIANVERARVAELEAARLTERQAGYQRAINVMRQEKLPMSVGLLEAQQELDALDAAQEKNNRELTAHEFAPARRQRLGEPIGCSNPRCSQGEWSAKAAERGWEQHGDGWLCPQCAADATDRSEFLAAQEASGAEAEALPDSPAAVATAHFSGQPDLESSEIHSATRVTFTIRPRTYEEWRWWVAHLTVPVDSITHRGNGLVTAKGSYKGVTVHLMAHGVGQLAVEQGGAS